MCGHSTYAYIPSFELLQQRLLLQLVDSPGHRIGSTYLVVSGNYGKHEVRHFRLWCVYDDQSLIKLLVHQRRRIRNERERRVPVLGLCPQLCLQLAPQVTTEGQSFSSPPDGYIQDRVQQGMLTQRNRTAERNSDVPHVLQTTTSTVVTQSLRGVPTLLRPPPRSWTQSNQ